MIAIKNFFLGLVAFSLVGNSLAIWELLRKRMRKKRSTVMFLNLTLADCLVTVFPMAGRRKFQGFLL